MMKRTSVLILALFVLLGAGLSAWALAEKPWETTGNQPVEVSAKPLPPAKAIEKPAAPTQYGPDIKPGNYLFDILGGTRDVVRVDSCGDKCLTLNTPTFTQQLLLDGNRYVGQATNPNGVLCSDGQPREAEVRYSVNRDGTRGLVEVLGEPCGPDSPNVPLVFTLLPDNAQR